MARSEEWQAEIRVMDKIATAMADLGTLTEAAQARVRSRVLEIYFPPDDPPAKDGAST